MRRALSVCILCLFILPLLNCERSVYIPPVVPDTVSFKKHIIPLFNNYCNSSGCHSGLDPQGNLNLEPAHAYAELWKKKMIDTIHPTNSLLYFQMTSVDKPMPPSGVLDTFYLKEVLRWIEQGGKNN
jgi:hypothetical protein